MNTAIVTGGAQGIGKAISLRLMKEGVFVIIIDVDDEALRDFNSEQQDNGLFRTMFCDVSNSHQLINVLERILLQKPSLKYLVNNAGISDFQPIDKLSIDDWNHILSVNLTSYFITAKYLSPALKENKGSIVNISSTRAFMSQPNSEAYAASKGGVGSLTHALAMSLQPNIRVNSISPGWIDVSYWQKKSKRKQVEWADKHHVQHPAGRIGTPKDVAEMAWFLLSDNSGFITGQNFMVDGGMTRKMIYIED